ncbi:MAG: alpha-amylase, partial [Bacteroidales bacterium]|nr:alpha-amylase [Bacteroidales bacterium]
CAVLCFTLPGSQPLIYTGQEIGLNRRLAFFEKDPITDWSANEYTSFWKKLVELKHNNPALAAGERGGDIIWWEVPVPETVAAFSREVKGNQVIVIANFGKEPYEPVFNIPGAGYTNHFTGEKIESPCNLSIAPGEYVVITK